MKMINSFFLIGPMGVGKTTVGRLLAQKLGYHFIDSDQWIVATQNQSIPEIFSSQGEDAFRDIESDAIYTLTEDANRVLSTGGGAILKEKNRQRLKQQGTVIFLDLSPENIFERIRHDKNRPLLQTENPLVTMQAIYNARKELYLDAAHYHVSTESHTPEEISDLLFCLYNDPQNFSSSWCIPLKK